MNFDMQKCNDTNNQSDNAFINRNNDINIVSLYLEDISDDDIETYDTIFKKNI